MDKWPAIQGMPAPGMILIRGQLNAAGFKTAVARALGVAVPKAGSRNEGGETSLGWMAPDELLAMVPPDQVSKSIADLERNLAEQHCLVRDVSDMRRLFRIAGRGARGVLAKGVPADTSPDRLSPGRLLRTRLGQVPVLIWQAGPNCFSLLCRLSEGEYVEEWLLAAARDRSLSERYPD